jgi:hypothetical protein
LLRRKLRAGAASWASIRPAMFRAQSSSDGGRTGMGANNTEQPAPQVPMTEAEFIEWMERLGFRVTEAQAREMLVAQELLARMKARVRSDRSLSAEPAHRFIVSR